MDAEASADECPLAASEMVRPQSLSCLARLHHSFCSASTYSNCSRTANSVSNRPFE